MIYRILLFVFILCINFKSYCQVTVSKSLVDYTLKIEQDSIYRILTFWKDKDSSFYSSVKYSVTDFNVNSTVKELEEEMDAMNQLWEIANDSIIYDLNSIAIGYPLIWSDVLKNHIHAFIDSKEWQNHVKQNGKKLDYSILKKVMLEHDVYQVLNDFLKTKGYQIAGFETEKHGFITKENLQKAGFSGTEIIPMPFMVWIKLSKL